MMDMISFFIVKKNLMKKTAFERSFGDGNSFGTKTDKFDNASIFVVMSMSNIKTQSIRRGRFCR